MGRKLKLDLPDAQSSVYGELKLSEQLANQLNMVRDQVDTIQEALEEAVYQRDANAARISEVEAKLIEREQKLNEAKQTIIELNHQSKSSQLTYEQIIRSSRYLINFVSVSEYYRKKFSEKLRYAMSKNDEQNNNIFELKQNKTLTNISYDILQTKLNLLYESIDGVTNTKKIQDTFEITVENQQKEIDRLKQDNVDNK